MRSGGGSYHHPRRKVKHLVASSRRGDNGYENGQVWTTSFHSRERRNPDKRRSWSPAPAYNPPGDVLSRRLGCWSVRQTETGAIAENPIEFASASCTISD